MHAAVHAAVHAVKQSATSEAEHHETYQAELPQSKLLANALHLLIKQNSCHTVVNSKQLQQARDTSSKVQRIPKSAGASISCMHTTDASLLTSFPLSPTQTTHSSLRLFSFQSSEQCTILAMEARSLCGTAQAAHVDMILHGCYCPAANTIQERAVVANLKCLHLLLTMEGDLGN